MAKGFSQSQLNGVAAYALFYGGDDGMTTFYDVASNANYLQYNGGIGRVGVRYDASASGLNQAARSVTISFRKYGSPVGNLTVNIRKGSDDTVAATLGTVPLQSVGPQDTTGEIIGYAFRWRPNTYQMLTNDLVSVEFPSNSTNGLEIAVNTAVGNPTGYTGRIHNGTVWANTTNPPAINIKGY